MTSCAPPGANGTTICIGRASGLAWAEADGAAHDSAKAAAAANAAGMRAIGDFIDDSVKLERKGSGALCRKARSLQPPSRTTRQESMSNETVPMVSAVWSLKPAAKAMKRSTSAKLLANPMDKRMAPALLPLR